MDKFISPAHEQLLLALKAWDDRGRPVASGIYFLQLKVAGKSHKTMKLLKM